MLNPLVSNRFSPLNFTGFHSPLRFGGPHRGKKWAKIKLTKRCKERGWALAMLLRTRLMMAWNFSCDTKENTLALVDGSFHTPEWHAARLANLNTSHTVTWEEFKRKQKEEALKRGELEADKDRMMREYRAQLDAERERKLAQGRNHSSNKSKRRKDKDKSSKRHSSKKRKRSRRRSSDSSSSSSSSESSSSDDEERESKRSKSRSKRKKERKHRSRCKNSSSDGEEAGGPLPLSRFFGSVKS